MADQSDHNTTMEELEAMLNDPNTREFFDLPPNEASRNVNEEESPLSSTANTPDPLNTAFFHETDISGQNSQISLSQQQQQSQTTNEASSAVHGLIRTIIEEEEEEDELHPFRSPLKKMKSTGTMPQTPVMVSIGTMTQTPVMISTGTIPTTPIGIIPQTPTMFSTSTVPVTPTAPVIVPASPTTVDTIDLRTPDTPTNTTDQHTPPNLAPQ